MSNQSYLNVWCKDFRVERILEQFGAFLGTVPFSAEKPGFTYLIIRAVDASEPPILEHDLRDLPLDAAGLLDIVRDHLHSDCSYEVRTEWDLWVFDPSSAKWKTAPQPLEIFCQGEDYDEGLWRENGHIEVDFGFEHLFTGHARLLGFRPNEHPAAESPEEAHFLEAMAWPENREAYQAKTRENIRKLLEWTRRIEKSVSVERIRLWSEGEDNFEARLEEILAAR